MAGWLLPISAEDPWRGLEQSCAPVGYWTQLTVKANGLWGGRLDMSSLAATVYQWGSLEREQAIAKRLNNATYGGKLTTVESE